MSHQARNAAISLALAAHTVVAKLAHVLSMSCVLRLALRTNGCATYRHVRPDATLGSKRATPYRNFALTPFA